MRPLIALMAAAFAYGADLCPSAADIKTGTVEGAIEWRSATAKLGRKQCVDNSVRNLGPTTTAIEWPGAGILSVTTAANLRVAICCYRHEAAQPDTLRAGGREIAVTTHRELPKPPGKEEDDDFPDLIEDDAHGRAISIQGTLGDGVRVDIVLRCTASKFADQFAYQYIVSNRSADAVGVEWDHLKRLRSELSPNIQPVAGGTAYIFITERRPTEAIATVELKSKEGKLLGRFQFDGFTLK